MEPLDSGYLPVDQLKNDIKKEEKDININNNGNDFIDNTEQNLNNMTNNPFLNEINNSNMNIDTANNLLNNDNGDDLDIFPNYPRPSLGNDLNANK